MRSVGAGSVVGAGMTLPMTFVPGGGGEGVDGLLRSTATEPVTTNSRPSRPRVAFGSERYASGLSAQVFHGTVIDAFDPEIVSEKRHCRL